MLCFNELYVHDNIRIAGLLELTNYFLIMSAFTGFQNDM